MHAFDLEFDSQEFKDFQKRADAFFVQVDDKKDVDADYEEFKRQAESLNSEMKSNKKQFDSEFEAVKQEIDGVTNDVKEKIASFEAEKEEAVAEETTLSREEILDQIDRIQLEIESDKRIYEILEERGYTDASLELQSVRSDERATRLRKLLADLKKAI